MFIKSAGFKKLIKEAYNRNGLRIGNDGKGIYICGGYWAIWVRKGHIPKKELAAIIELTGGMPDEGAGFKSGRAGNQYEMAEGDTIVENSIFVERGYQDICKDLTQLGAEIRHCRDTREGEIIGK